MINTVQFLDLKAQYQSIKSEVNEAILKVLESSSYVLGPEVTKFEEEFSSYQAAQFGIAVNTGTSALHVALLAAGVGAGDEVIVPAMTFVATASAVSYTGAKPVFVDIEAGSMTIDPRKIEEKITSATKAIIPVHLYGQAADMNAIMLIAKKYNLVVIEDAAQAHGAEYQGKRVGSIGDMGAFSFYPGKNLGAYGEGGLVTTNSPELANKMKLLRDWGQEKKYHHDILAYNYRMDAIQGAILRIKLKYLESWTEMRRAHALIYEAYLKTLNIDRAKEITGRRHVYHIYSLFHPQRDLLQKTLLADGIQTGLHYPIPVHLQKMYQNLGYAEGSFPMAERIAKEQLSLPMFAELTRGQIDQTVTSIEKFIVRLT